MSMDITQLEQEMALELMPEVVADISELIGYPKALKLIERLGGLDYRMPKSGNEGQYAQMLIAAIGDESADLLMQRYGGTRLYIPRCTTLMIQLRNHEFVANVQMAVASGSSQTWAIQQYAPKYGFSERWAYEVLKHKTRNQLDLF